MGHEKGNENQAVVDRVFVTLLEERLLVLRAGRGFLTIQRAKWTARVSHDNCHPDTVIDSICLIQSVISL